MGKLIVRTALRASSLAIAALAALVTGLSAQQSGSIRGQATDAVTLRPLAGVQISVVGTGRGGLANAAGQFIVLNVPAGTHTVRAELIGYAPVEQEITVAAGQSAQLDFGMAQQALALDEIVVTGTAGQTQRRAIGNSVTQFNAESVTDAVPVPSLQEMLQARAPGLTIISNGGGAGDGSQIRLRGAGSLEGRFEPVIYVDGVRIESDGAQSGMCGSVTHCTSALDFLNPNDIERFEIIKGPAASTLYGAEAAGGVVQIFTKRGRPGTGIQWSAGIDMGTSDWALDRPVTYWQCTAANVAPTSTFPGCHGEAPGTLLEYRPMDDHPEAMRGNTGSSDPNGAGQYAFNLSARGGGQSFSYFLSAEQSDEQGVFLNNYARRTGGRANFNFTPTDQIDFTVNMGYARTNVRSPLSNNSSNSILRNAYRARADAAYQYEVGYRNFGPTLANEWDLTTIGERFTVGSTVNYEPFSWFSNRLVLGLDFQDRQVTDFTGIDQTGQAPWGTTRAAGYINHEIRPLHNWTVDYSGTFSTDINPELTSSFSAGMQLLARQSELFSIEGEGLVANNLNLVSSAAINRGGQGFSEQTSLGFYLQEQVGWRNRLFVTAAVRIDDNSAFGDEFSLVAYPKAQLSYVISDEDWFEYGMIDQLKLRAAWGQAGNPPDPFVADRTYEADATVVGDQVVNLLTPSSYGNPNLKAETGSELELGFESSLWNGRLGLDFTYYNQKTRDALIAVPDPRSSGFDGEHFVNVGEISSTGFEFLLTTTPLYTRALQWDATVSFSRNTGELVTWGDAPLTQVEFGSFLTVQRHLPGYPLGGFWSTDVVRDANGVPVLDSGGDVTVATEKVYEGPSNPTREIGFANSFTILDNFRVFANLDYKGGHYQWCAICSVRSRIDLNTRLTNDPNADPVDVAVATSLQTKTFIKPADFIKLREISVSYRIPSSLLSNVRLDDATVTLAGRNLWMWTKYEFDQEGFGSPDPEVNFDSQSRFGRTDYASIPMLRTFSLGLRLNF